MVMYDLEAHASQMRIGKKKKKMVEVLTKTLPYLLTGFRIGIERALKLTGLTSGACQRVATLKPMISGIIS
jgi:hypothetical protein